MGGNEVDWIEQFIEARRGASLSELVAELADLREEKEQIEAQLAALWKCYDALRSTVIPERMDEEGVSSMTFPGLGCLGLTDDARASLVPAEGEPRRGAEEPKAGRARQLMTLSTRGR